MKKLSLVLVALLIFFSIVTPVRAGTIEKKEVDVIAQYIRETEEFHQVSGKNGEGNLIKKEDVKVSVSDAPKTADNTDIAGPVIALAISASIAGMVLKFTENRHLQRR